MKTSNWLVSLAAVCVMAMILGGCGSDDSGSGGDVDVSKPVSEVKTEAEKMDVEQLRAIAMKYKSAITSKEGEIKEIAKKIAEIPLTEALGAEMKSLKGEVDELKKTVDALTERLTVYVGKLKELKGDLAGLE